MKDIQKTDFFTLRHYRVSNPARRRKRELSAASVVKASRMEEFDALRGIAAASVFVCHAIALTGTPTTNRLLSLVSDGNAPVGLFFVLSGFVLARSLMLRHSTYAEFAVRRCFRIYPAYWFGIALAGLLIWGHAQAGLSDLANWPAHVWDHPVPLDQKFRYVGLIGPGLDSSFISPIWSLQVEMRVSLIFPLLFTILVFSPIWFCIFLVVASTLLGVFSSPTIVAIPIFLLGIALARNEEHFRNLQIPRLTGLALLSVGMVLYAVRPIFDLHVNPLTEYASALGAALIMLAVIVRPSYATALRFWPLGFMGRISYSFYLVHLPIIFFVASYLHRYIGLTASAVIAFAVTLVIAYLMYELIERPGIAVGGKAARLFRRRHLTASP